MRYPDPVPAGWCDGLDLAAVLAGQGINPSSRAAQLPALRDKALQALREGRGLLAPAVATRLARVEQADLLRVVLGGGLSIEGAPARLLSGSLQVVAVACTVGDAIDRRASDAMREDPALALAFDGIGTAAVNLLADVVCRDLRTDAARAGQSTTAPLSPGQGEWDLEAGQRLLFALTEPGRIGLSLSESAQMRPRKSLSFLIGIGPTVRDHASRPCGGCASRPGCHYTNLRKNGWPA